MKVYSKGLTFLEMLIVMIITGILVTIVIINYGNSIYTSKVQAVENNLRGIAAAQEKYYEDNGHYCSSSSSGACTSFDSMNQNLSLTMSTQTTDIFSYWCATSQSQYCPYSTPVCCYATYAAPPGQVRRVSIDINGNLTCFNSYGPIPSCP